MLIKRILLPMSLMFTLSITLWGMLNIYEANTLSINNNMFSKQLIYVIIGGMVIEGLSRILNQKRLVSVAILSMLIIVLCGNIFPLITNILLAISCYILGCFTFALLRLKLLKNSVVFSFLVGVVIIGTVIGLMVHYPINYSGTYGLLIVTILYSGRGYVRELWEKFNTHFYELKDYTWIDLCLGLVIIYYILLVQMPEVGHDALTTHLFVPTYVEQNLMWSFDVNTYVWATMPMLVDWVYTAAYILSGEFGPRLTNAGFFLIIAYIIHQIVLWAGGNALGARWAALLLLVLPLTGHLTNTLYIESIWTAIFVGGTFLILIFLFPSRNKLTELDYRDRLNSNIVISGLLLGGAAAAKAVTLSMLPALAILILFRIRGWLGTIKLKSIFIGIFLFVMIGIIPYLNAWLITGNPVFPFFNEIFKSPQYPEVNFSASVYGKGLSWDTLFHLSFNSNKYIEGGIGVGGFHILLLLLPALFMFTLDKKYRGLSLLFVGILAAAIPFQQTAYMRYIYPSYVIITAGIGVFLSIALADKSSITRFLVVLCAGLGLFLNSIFYKTGIKGGNIMVSALLSEEGRETYLDSWLPLRNAVETVNELNVSNHPVAILSQPLAAGLESEAIYANWYNHSFLNLILQVKTQNSMIDLLKEQKIKYVLLDDYWRFKDKKKLVENVTIEIVKIGSISVRELNKTYTFTSELLKNGIFQNKENWYVPEGTFFKKGSAKLTINSAISQAVPIRENVRVFMSAETICPVKDSIGRLQINWHNENDEFIKTSIKTFPCKDIPETHSVEYVSPNNTKYGIVYISGHLDEPITFKSVSVKK